MHEKCHTCRWGWPSGAPQGICTFSLTVAVTGAGGAAVNFFRTENIHMTCHQSDCWPPFIYNWGICTRASSGVHREAGGGKLGCCVTGHPSWGEEWASNQLVRI